MARRLDANRRQKELILEKAGELFWDRGYDNTSVRDIARGCGFESSNIYYYFQNKEFILFELLWREVSQLDTLIKPLATEKSGTPSERLRSLIKIHLELTLKNQSASLRLLPDTELKRLLPGHRVRIIRARDAYDRILRQIIQSGIASGEFAPMDEKLAGFAIASMIVRTRIWFAASGKYSVGDIAEFIFNFATHGLGMAGK